MFKSCIKGVLHLSLHSANLKLTLTCYVKPHHLKCITKGDNVVKVENRYFPFSILYYDILRVITS